MILRKPYAFLIKNFRKINFILLAFTFFMLWKDLSLYGFVKDYISTGIYNTVLDSINNYINGFVYLVSFIILIVSFILVYLFKYKNKPYFLYLFTLILNVVTLILMLYVKYYFTYTISTEFVLSQALVVRDLVFISTLPYYLIIFLLIIRTIGLDLKNFGFGEDKEFIDINEEDREEVEVEVKFDKDKVIRKIKNKIRMTKYFVVEHKVPIVLITLFVVLIASFNVYHYIFVENKIYKLNEIFESDNYKISVNNTYITNRDYTGNIIDKKMYYLVSEVTLTNLSNSSRLFDPSNFYLFVDNNYYLPSDRYNTYFVDMGNLFEKDKTIKAKETKKILFVYEIKEPSKNSNFLLSYQNTDISKNAKRIRVNVSDISKFITKGNSVVNEEIEVPINLQDKYTFTLSNFQLNKSMNYRYGECNTSGTCPIYEKTLVAPDDKTILFFKFDIDDKTKSEFISFITKYGKIRYKVDGVKKEQKIKNALNSYRGDYAYLLANQELENASEISIVLTIRSYQYFYTLKGE